METQRKNRPGLAAQRAKIAAAGFSLLGRKGLEDASVEDVLAEAAVSRQTFYRAFSGMDALFAEVRRRIEGFLTESLASRLKDARTPADWIGGYLDAVIDASLAAGPAVLALDREEKRPGSPFYGATAKRQASLAELAAGWARARFALELDPLQVIAVLAACRELCLRVAAPSGRKHGGVARAKEAGRALAEGLLLRAGARAGLWTVTPRSKESAVLLPPDIEEGS